MRMPPTFKAFVFAETTQVSDGMVHARCRAILADYRTIGDELCKRFKAGRDERLWYYRSLVTALRQGGTRDRCRSLVGELEHVVTALEHAVRSASGAP